MSKEQEFNIFGEFENLVPSEPLESTTDDKLPEGVIVVDEDSSDKTPGLEDEEKDEVEDEDESSDESKEKVEDKSKSKEKKSDKSEKIDKKESKVEEDIEESTEEDEEESQGSYSFKALANYLADQGAIDFEDSEDLEDSPELIIESVRKTALNMVEEWKESLPEEGIKFLSYLEKGGDPNKYLSTLEKPLDLESIDLSKVDNQKRVISEHLKATDHTQEEIDEILSDYEDALMLEKQAKIASKKLEKIYEKSKQELLEAQEQAEKARQKQFEEYINNIKSSIDSSKTLAGLDVNANDKKALEAYLLKTDKDGLTQWQKDLKENPIQTQLELAYLKMKKFDFSKISKKLKTEVTKEFKGIFNGNSKTVKGKSKQYEDADDKAQGSLDAFKSIFV